MVRIFFIYYIFRSFDHLQGGVQNRLGFSVICVLSLEDGRTTDTVVYVNAESHVRHLH
jgi:hypothetical protein